MHHHLSSGIGSVSLACCQATVRLPSHGTPLLIRAVLAGVFRSAVAKAGPRQSRLAIHNRSQVDPAAGAGQGSGKVAQKFMIAPRGGQAAGLGYAVADAGRQPTRRGHRGGVKPVVDSARN